MWSKARLVLNPTVLKIFKATELKKLVEGSQFISVEGMKRITELVWDLVIIG